MITTMRLFVAAIGAGTLATCLAMNVSNPIEIGTNIYMIHADERGAYSLEQVADRIMQEANGFCTRRDQAVRVRMADIVATDAANTDKSSIKFSCIEYGDPGNATPDLRVGVPDSIIE